MVVHLLKHRRILRSTIHIMDYLACGAGLGAGTREFLRGAVLEVVRGDDGPTDTDETLEKKKLILGSI